MDRREEILAEVARITEEIVRLMTHKDELLSELQSRDEAAQPEGRRP